MDFEKICSELQRTAHKYRANILSLPKIGLSEINPYVTSRGGIIYKETTGHMDSSAELRPYNGEINSKQSTELKARTIETFLGSLVELFEPAVKLKTVWGKLEDANPNINKDAFLKAVLMNLMSSVLEKLNNSLWAAKQKDGETTMDLYNGWDTIAEKEIAAGNISESLGNLIQLASAINDNNAYDLITGIWRSADDGLKAAPRSYIYCPFSAYESYCKDYKTVTGNSAYNTKYEQTFVEGSSNRCVLVPLSSKMNSSMIQLSTKENMLLGYGGGTEGEIIDVRRGDNPFKLQLILMMLFGAEYESIDSRRLLVAKLAE